MSEPVLPSTKLFHDVAFQRALLLAIGLYLLTLLITQLIGQTVLMAVAIVAYILTPPVLAVALTHSVPQRTNRQLLRTMVTWLAGTAVVLTVALYLATDVWNPDHFRYDFGDPPIAIKILTLLILQWPWIAASVPLGLLPILLPRKSAAAAEPLHEPQPA